MTRNYARWTWLYMTMFSGPLVKTLQSQDWWTSYVVYPSTVED